MKHLLLISCCVVIFASTAWAETAYISENIRLPVRQEPGNNKKIISIAMTGDQIEILQKGPDWSKIQLADGKQGWAMTRFLTAQVPCSAQLRDLQKKYADMQSNAAGTASEGTDMLKQENQKLAAEQQNCTKEYQAISEKYETLKNDAADVVKLRTSYEGALSKVSEQAKKIELLEATAGKSTFAENFRWFLAGGGVFLAGYLVGSISRKKRAYSFIRYRRRLFTGLS